MLRKYCDSAQISPIRSNLDILVLYTVSPLIATVRKSDFMPRQSKSLDLSAEAFTLVDLLRFRMVVSRYGGERASAIMKI